jgi:hypothetical protein
VSKEKRKKFSHWGARPNSGPKKGSGEKVKICVSVDSDNWNTAIRRWNEKPSRLVDGLISDYVKIFGSVLEKEAAI